MDPFFPLRLLHIPADATGWKQERIRVDPLPKKHNCVFTVGLKTHFHKRSFPTLTAVYPFVIGGNEKFISVLVLTEHRFFKFITRKKKESEISATSRSAETSRSSELIETAEKRFHHLLGLLPSRRNNAAEVSCQPFCRLFGVKLPSWEAGWRGAPQERP